MGNPYPWDPNDPGESRPKPAFLKNWDPNGPEVMSGPGQFRRQGSPMDEFGNAFMYDPGGSQGFRSVDPAALYAGQGRGADPRSASQKLAGQTAQDRRYGGGWGGALGTAAPYASELAASAAGSTLAPAASAAFDYGMSAYAPAAFDYGMSAYAPAASAAAAPTAAATAAKSGFGALIDRAIAEAAAHPVRTGVQGLSVLSSLSAALKGSGRSPSPSTPAPSAPFQAPSIPTYASTPYRAPTLAYTPYGR